MPFRIGKAYKSEDHFIAPFLNPMLKKFVCVDVYRDGSSNLFAIHERLKSKICHVRL
jgi:hypothetical protein